MYREGYYFTPTSISEATITLKGDMLQFYTDGGLYLSGNSPLLSANRYDFYSNVRSVSSNFPPFEGVPADYIYTKENGIQFTFPRGLPLGTYDIIFCNPAGYVIASQTKRFNKIILAEFELTPVGTFSKLPLVSFTQRAIKTIRKYLNK